MLPGSLDEKKQWWKYQEMLPVSLDEKKQWWRLQKMLPASLDEKKQWWKQQEMLPVSLNGKIGQPRWKQRLREQKRLIADALGWDGDPELVDVSVVVVVVVVLLLEDVSTENNKR